VAVQPAEIELQLAGPGLPVVLTHGLRQLGASAIGPCVLVTFKAFIAEAFGVTWVKGLGAPVVLSCGTT
jgi:hypothetical protein